MNSSAAALRAAFRRHSNPRTLCLLLGLLLLALMIWGAGPRDLWDQARSMSRSLPAVVAIWGFGYLLNACSWGTVIRTNPLRRPLPFGALYRYTVTGFALNYITPLGLLGGEPYRIVELRPHLGLERASGSVLLYMMMHITSHLILWITTCLLVLIHIHGLTPAWQWGLGGIALLSLGGLWLFYSGYRRGLLAGLLRALGRWPIVGRRIAAIKPQTHRRVTHIDDNVRSLLGHHRGAFAASLTLEYASRLVNTLEIYVLLTHLGLPATLWGSVVIVGLSSLLANLLFFSPLQLGTREGGILLAMQVVYPGLTLTELMPQAIALSLMTRLREFIWIAIGLIFLKIPKRG